MGEFEKILLREEGVIHWVLKYQTFLLLILTQSLETAQADLLN